MTISPKKKVTALREQMRAAKLDAYFIPSVDPHQSEYLPECWQRRAFISGFNGSAGDIIVTQERAGLWTDGRYYIQAAAQLRGSGIKLFKAGKKRVPSTLEWIAENLEPGQTLGADPRVLSQSVAAKLKAAVGRAGAQLELLERNLVDAIWHDQPMLPQAQITVHPTRYAGETLPRKLERLRATLTAEKADALVITTLDAIAWTFNIRGEDVAYNPVVIGYGLITGDAATLFCHETKVSAALREALAPHVEIRPYEAFGKALAALGRRRAQVWVDPSSVNAWVLSKLRRAKLLETASPIVAMKARKNAKESAGARKAHVRDGVAMVRFLHWLSEAVPAGGQDEISAAEKLAELRAEGDLFRFESFAPISAYAGNAAIVHYSAEPESAATLRPRGLYLIDSGGQYLDGTTDITRTVLLGKRATAAQKDHFTRVLKGHIAISTLRFPTGTPGRHLDSFARKALWDAGLDYAHGTGHGVGAFLSVHEGPQAISPTRCTGAALEPGNILSNEPGCYVEGAYGIRIENLELVVVDEDLSKNGASFLRFETLTLCPIDTRLVDAKLLDAKERRWLDRYHQRVYKELGPLVEPATRRWLRSTTAKLLPVVD